MLLVEKRIEATKTKMMTGTTKNGEVMLMMSGLPLKAEYQKLRFLEKLGDGQMARLVARHLS